VDLLTPKERQKLPQMISDRLPMLRYAPLVETSALNGDGLDAALDLVCEAGFWRQFRVPRRRLNELFTRMQTLRPLPKVKALKAGQAGRIRVLYVLQAYTEAPTFVVHLNRQAELHTGDMGWLENTIRGMWPYVGTPLRIVLRSRDIRKRRRDKEITPSGRRRRKGGAPGGRGEDAAHDHEAPRLAVGRLHG
jgi:GTP-binding protein